MKIKEIVADVLEQFKKNKNFERSFYEFREDEPFDTLINEQREENEELKGKIVDLLKFHKITYAINHGTFLVAFILNKNEGARVSCREEDGIYISCEEEDENSDPTKIFFNALAILMKVHNDLCFIELEELKKSKKRKKK